MTPPPLPSTVSELHAAINLGTRSDSDKLCLTTERSPGAAFIQFLIDRYVPRMPDAALRAAGITREGRKVTSIKSKAYYAALAMSAEVFRQYYAERYASGTHGPLFDLSSLSDIPLHEIETSPVPTVIAPTPVIVPAPAPVLVAPIAPIAPVTLSPEVILKMKAAAAEEIFKMRALAYEKVWANRTFAHRGWWLIGDTDFAVIELKAVNGAKLTPGTPDPTGKLYLTEYGTVCTVVRPDGKWYSVYDIRMSNEPDRGTKQSIVPTPLATGSTTRDEAQKLAMAWAGRNKLAARDPNDRFETKEPSESQQKALAAVGLSASTRFEAGMKISCSDLPLIETRTHAILDMLGIGLVTFVASVPAKATV